MAFVRCGWEVCSEAMQRYHDEEWGVPRFDDAGQFEFLTLESAQAGLSWSTILNKRAGYRRCFAGFDPEQVAHFTPADVERLMADPGIVRNRRKIESAITNAQLFLDIVARYGSFCAWFWSFVDGRPVQNAWKSLGDLPATSPLSDNIAKEMKKMGFKFMGSTILYAHMQATGMVNDHITSCFRYEQIRALALSKL